MDTSPIANPQLTFLDVTADPAAATRLRQSLSTWLGAEVPESSEHSDAITLAVYEAMANAVEHAYAHQSEPGHMTLRATYHRDVSLLSITVQDHGRWQEVTASLPGGLRGRGIPLMQALSDHPRINPTAHGTVVILEWNFARDTSESQPA